MTDASILDLTSNNLPAFGEVLHAQFLKNVDYRALYHITEAQPSQWQKVRGAISDIYTKAGLGSYEEIEYKNSNNIRIADIVEFDNGRTYCITGIKNQIVRTFPSKIAKDHDKLNPLTPGFSGKIRRPNLDNIKSESYNALIKETLPEQLLDEMKKTADSFKSVPLPDDSTHLQIGDLVFGVDPIQISFTTQNGYQYYPTLRTSGNPKLPTGQQIKNINIVLIFPNVDAINYQLIPLYAMFRRTPFVNVKNRDLTNFYEDIATSTGYIPVALESLHVQSIEGFPNSLQATVTLLPFEPGLLSKGTFRALKTFDDVYIQQENLDQDQLLNHMMDLADFKMQETTTSITRFKGLTQVATDSSENFRDSIPFRAFYQAMIAEHRFIRNEAGNPIETYGLDDLTKSAGYDLSFLAPRDSKNFLHHYIIDSNRGKFTFKYSYPTFFDEEKSELAELRDVANYISVQRLDNRSERLNKLRDLFNNLTGYKGLANVMFSAFPNMSDALRPIEYQYSRLDNIINTVLAQQNLDPVLIKSDSKKVGIAKLFSFLYRSLLQKTSIAALSSVAKSLKNIPNAEYNPAAADMWAILGQEGLLYIEANAGDISNYGVHTVEGAFKDLWEWIEEGATQGEEGQLRKNQIILAMENIGQTLQNELYSSTIIVSPGESFDSTEFAIRNLPLKEKVFEIDNKKDVITSWSLVFSNKFVPMYLSAYKYPFYQHLGSDDPTLSLSVVSVPSENKTDLKSELSFMSDKLYDSVKLVMHTSPDLYTWMDPRVTVDAPHGSIFDAFGIRKVILNATNSTNIQGQPDSWNTVINLTQANFSIEQYHSLSSVSNLSEFETIIAQLLPRIRKKNKSSTSMSWQPQDFEVIDLRHKEKVLSLDDIIYLSFLLSPAGERFILHLEDVTEAKTIKDITGTDLISHLGPVMNTLIEIDPRVVNEKATARLWTILSENRQFGDLLNAIVYEYENLLEKQADVFINLVNRKRTAMEEFKRAMKKDFLTGLAITAGTIGLALALNLIPVAGQIASGIVITGGIAALAIGGTTSVGQEWITNKIHQDFSGLVARIVNVYKKEMLSQLSHAVMKDPPIRKKLFDPEFIALALPASTIGGDRSQPDIEKQIEQRKNSKRINCYQDFDIPLFWEKDNRLYRAAPDFYLHNITDPTSYLATYVKESTSRLLKIGKMGMQLALVEHKSLFEKYDQISKNIVESQINTFDKPLQEIKEEIGFDNLDDALTRLGQVYRIVALKDENVQSESDLSNDLNNITIDKERAETLIKQFESVNEELKKNDPKMYEYERSILEYSIRMNIAPKIQSRDLLKYNIIYTARMKTLMEIMALGHQIQMHFAQRTALQGDISVDDKSNKLEDIWKKVKVVNKKDQLDGQSQVVLNKMGKIVNTVLNNWQKLTTNSLNEKTAAPKGSKNKESVSLGVQLEPLMKYFNKGLYATPVDDTDGDNKYLGLPAIRQLEAEVYNKIGYYIRLNTVIDQANSGLLKTSGGNAPFINMDSLPELQFIDAFNVRTTESVFRQAEIERQILDSVNRTKNITLNFFPTFKIFFIEEDGSRYNQLDDYYAYNAVQSIEISKSKTSASTIAVLRLSNLTGTITDRLSFHRERSDFLQLNDPLQEDEAFFGTLDIKPGTKVQIKMGYAADERYLPTVFTGRIMEMNVGPTTEMICQSYAAQLNHKITQHKFGFFASEKEYGDIASALLDMIPGLENLGKKDIINIGLLGGYSFKNAKKLRANLFDNFLLTNLLGRLTADIVATDNPRDENIYLPFNISVYPRWKPRFDWVVYNQSVWDAIKEIALYTNNCDVVVKQYNNDPLSERSEQRETLIVGNKSGYYKFTDSLPFSTINTDDITTRIQEFKEIMSRDVLSQPFIDRGKQEGKIPLLIELKTLYSEIFDDIRWVDKFINPSLSLKFKSTGLGLIPIYGTLKPKYENLWNWLSEPLNAAIIKKAFLDEVDLSINSIGGFIGSALKRHIKSLDTMSRAVDLVDLFSTSASILQPTINNTITSQKGQYFPEIIVAMSAITGIEGKEKFWDLRAEKFFSVREAVNNMNPSLASDPRYRKIQQHHLISDGSNLISNSIALNSNFPNKINLYYLDEPEFINNLSEVQPEKWEKLNVWPIRAFGDIRDDHIRQMDIFQKNIDPWWFDIKEKQLNFFKGYRRLYEKTIRDKNLNTGNDKDENRTFKERVEDINVNLGSFNIHTPDWRAFPAFQIVGVNLLRKEVAKMYRGTLQIIGDPNIEPMDILHIQDYINDMHGIVEVDEVTHTFTPDRGFMTTITPSLITYDRDPIQLEDIAVINRIFDMAEEHKRITKSKMLWGSVAFAGGAALTLSKQPVFGGAVGIGGALAAFSGISSVLGNRYHKFLYDSLGNILGRDVINFTALLYHGQPYMCGFDGVDYTTLKTLMIHKAENVNNLISRITTFMDPFAASVYTNFNPSEFGIGKALMNKAGMLKWITNLPTHGQLNDAFQLRDQIFGGG
jgi:hypothetical protein